MARFSEKLRKLILSKRGALNIGLGLLVVLVFMGGAAEFTSRPGFCTTCHYMEPFYESWQTSSHEDVTCTKCHFPPGFAGTVRGKVEGLVQVANYVTRAYARRKPWAEIDDASCLQSGCHDTRLLQDTVRFQNVTFAHQPHLAELRRGKTLRCTSCHSQIVQGEHMVVTETSCFLCHFKKSDEITLAAYETLSNCRSCHKEAPAAGEDSMAVRFDHTRITEHNIDCRQCHNQTIVGDGAVPIDNCYTCHFEPEHLERIGETVFLHNKHISENKIECEQCHLRIEHKIQRLKVEEELNCTTCHTATHREQLMLFTGADGAGIGAETVANPMFEAGLDCASCHAFHEPLIGQGSVEEARPQVCETCHGEGYARLLALWNEGFDNKVSTFKQAVRRVESGLRSASAGTASAAQPLVQQAKNGLHVVEVGRAVHNVAYADRILQAGYQNLRRAAEQARLNVSLPQFEASNVPGECANCHSGVETLSTTFQGKTFSHETHVASRNLACNTCHSNVRKHGELIVGTANCNSCHHRQPAQLDCAGCHETAAAIYAGTFLSKDSPDLMFDAEVECADCHVAKKQLVKPDAQVCVDCHDDDYLEMGQEWQADVQGLLAEVKALLAQVKATPAGRNTDAYRTAQNVVRGIEEGAAGGLHNYDLTFELLDDAKTALENLLAGT